MKKSLVLLVSSLIFILLFLSGCGGGGSESGSGSVSSSNTYTLSSNENYALLGPLENATVKVYYLANLKEPISTTTTDENGSFKITYDNTDSSHYLYNLPHYLLVSISNGYDTDKMDTGKRNTNGVENKGTFYGFAREKDINEFEQDSTRKYVRINPLTDYIYFKILEQYNYDLSSIDFTNYSEFKTFESYLNKFSKELVGDINGDNTVDYYDVLAFVPSRDKTKTKINWDFIHENIIKAIHRGDNFTIRNNFNKNLGKMLNDKSEDSALVQNGKKIEKIEVSNGLVKKLSLENNKMIETTLQERDSGKYVGNIKLNTEDKKAEISFPISKPELFGKTADELSKSSILDIKIEQHDNGEYIATIPKELIDSWAESKAKVVINGREVDADVINDDPTIGWFFPEDELADSKYLSDFVRPFNYKNLPYGISFSPSYRPFYMIKDNLNPENSIVSSTPTWNELTNSIELKYQVLYYFNNDESEDTIRNINLKLMLKELDILYDDYLKSKFKNIKLTLPKEFKNIYYFIGPDNFIAVDAESKKIIASSIDKLVNKNFVTSMQEFNRKCTTSTGASGIKIKRCNELDLEGYFKQLGYFTWTQNNSYIENLTNNLGFEKDLEFTSEIELSDNGESESDKNWFSSKDVVYDSPNIKLTSDFSNKNFLDGSSIDIKWEATQWNGKDVMIAIECKDNGSEKWWAIDTVSNVDGEENSYTWKIGDFKENSSVWDDIKHDTCRIEVAKNKFHYDSDRSRYFTISKSLKPVKYEIVGPTEVSYKKNVDFNFIVTYNDGSKKNLNPKLWILFYPETTQIVENNYASINNSGTVYYQDIQLSKLSVWEKYKGYVDIYAGYSSQEGARIRVKLNNSGVNYQWSIGKWSNYCVNKIKTRSVICINSYGNKVNDSQCSSIKPATSQSCISDTTSYKWVAESWGNCDANCGTGNGTQTRIVTCKSSNGSTVSDSYCSTAKPATSQSCTASQCGGNNLMWQDDNSWHYLNWNDSRDYCSNLVLDNFTDWRLPSNEELLYLQKHQNILKNNLVDKIHNTIYWTSKETNQILYEAYAVEMEYGWNDSQSKDSEAYVKCVRGK